MPITPRALLFAKGGEVGEHSARLEGAGLLEELRLEEDACAREPAQRRRAERRCPVEPIADRVACCLDVRELDHG